MHRLFIETPVFKQLLDTIKDFGLERVIKDEILKDPSAGDIITGTGGVRKIRIPKKGEKGKSGGYRVLYLDLPNMEIVYLILIFDKNVVANIPNSHKKQIKTLVEDLKNEWLKSNK